MSTNLELICKKWECCLNCERSRFRSNVCVYDGAAKPVILFVKAAPSKTDDILGKVFSGEERRFIEDTLLDLIASLFPNYQVGNDIVERLCGYISIVACYSPSSPEKEEVKACSERLDKVLKSIEFDYPYPICLVGKVTKAFLPKSWKIYNKYWQLPNFMDEVKSERLIHSIQYKKNLCSSILCDMLDSNRHIILAKIKGCLNESSVERPL